MKKLWQECLTCDSKCCNLNVAHPLFITEEEMEHIKNMYPDEFESFNKAFPCHFLNEDGLCEIHEIKPADCRFFPFDMIIVDDKILWIVRQIGCTIVDGEESYEEYLKDFEEKLIPDFCQHLKAYADFRADELASKYKLKVLREVKISR